jgi:hypothetical protein
MSTDNQNSIQLTWYGRLGDWAKQNQGDFAVVAGFLLVALISFGIGYLTAPGMAKNQLIIENPQADISETAAGNVGGTGDGALVSGQAALKQTNGKGLIVASKNSKIYHWPWEAAAKKIKPENEVWFASEAEAQASGRSRSADFAKLAPAGYTK